MPSGSHARHASHASHARQPRHAGSARTGVTEGRRHVAPTGRALPTIVPLGAATLLTAVSMAGVVLTQSTLGVTTSSAASVSGAPGTPVLRASVVPAVAAAGTTALDTRSVGYRSGVSGSNATGPARRMTVTLPMPGCPAPVAPGEFANGKIPAEYLCELPDTGGQLLRSDAAAAWVHLATAYREHFGTALCITDSYRSLKVQKQLFKRKPLLAAIPGTSNHGLGIAVDLCGGIDHADSVTHAWMQANAPQFGWTNPAWAQPDGSKPEPWHWEYAAPTGSATTS